MSIRIKIIKAGYLVVRRINLPQFEWQSTKRQSSNHTIKTGVYIWFEDYTDDFKRKLKNCMLNAHPSVTLRTITGCYSYWPGTVFINSLDWHVQYNMRLEYYMLQTKRLQVQEVSLQWRKRTLSLRQAYDITQHGTRTFVNAGCFM